MESWPNDAIYFEPMFCLFPLVDYQSLTTPQSVGCLCQNGGYCSDRNNPYSCVCPQGYTGRLCETREYLKLHLLLLYWNPWVLKYPRFKLFLSLFFSNQQSFNFLTYWGRVTHICVGNLIIIGSDNGLSPGRRQAIIWTNAGILLVGPLGTNFSEILSAIHASSFKKMHLKMSSA